MRRGFLLALVLLVSAVSRAEAHHVVGHGGGVGGSFNPYAGQSRRPTSYADFTFGMDRLDGGLGYVLTYQVAGEYAPLRRLSLGVRVPFLSIREKFLPKTDGIGDVAVSVKGLLAEWPLQKLFLQAGTEVSFPTGSLDKGTGSGDVVFSPYLTLSKRFRPVTLLLTAGSTLAASDPVRPSADYAATAIIPVTEGNLPVDFFLSFQGSTAVQSGIFTGGSTKAYLRPAFVFHLSSKLLATLSGKFSVLDTLEIQPGISLARQSTAPLSDVQAGFLFNMNYSF